MQRRAISCICCVISLGHFPHKFLFLQGKNRYGRSRVLNTTRELEIGLIHLTSGKGRCNLCIQSAREDDEIKRGVIWEQIRLKWEIGRILSLVQTFTFHRRWEKSHTLWSILCQICISYIAMIKTFLPKYSHLDRPIQKKIRVKEGLFLWST